MAGRDATRPGVLILTPRDGEERWEVVEVDEVVFGRLCAAGSALDQVEQLPASVGAALGAAYEVLTLITEGRMPAMHEYVQESVREFVEELEAKGFDRRTALKLLLQVVDDMAERSPVGDRRAPGDTELARSMSHAS